MKKAGKIGLMIIALGVVLAAGMQAYGYMHRKMEVASFKGYYNDLAKQCEQKGTYGCCIASVRRMAENNYTLMQGDACAVGHAPDMLRCVDSFQWCVPVAESAISECDFKCGDNKKISCETNKDCNSDSCGAKGGFVDSGYGLSGYCQAGYCQKYGCGGAPAID